MLHLYRRHAVWCEPEPLDSRVCRDPDDDWVLPTAVSGQVEIIVTGDNDLLTVEAFRGIAILSPRRFTKSLQRLDERS